MAITRVNFIETNQWNGITSTTLASTALAITAGNTIVACVGGNCAAGQTITGVTDTAGNTYTKVIGTFFPGDNYKQDVWVAKNCLGHAANVVTTTYSAAVDFRASVIIQYAGLSRTAPVVDAKSQNTGPQPYTTPTLTVSGKEYAALIQCRWGFGGRTFPTGFTRFTVGGAGVAEVADKIATDGPLATTYTISPGDYFIIGVILGAASPYTQAVIADGAVEYLPLDDTSGTTAVASVGTNATRTGGLIAQPGILNTGYAFSVDGDGLVIPSTATVLNTLSAITAEVWVKFTAATLTGGAAEPIIKKYITPTMMAWNLSLEPGNVLTWRVYSSADNAEFTQILGTGIIQPDQWTHLVGTYDGTSTVALYINGVLVGSKPASFAMLTGVDVTKIAVSSTTTMTGGIDEVAIYPTALTPTQIQTHYTALVAVAGSGGWSEWFDDEYDTYEDDIMAYNQWGALTPSNTTDLTVRPLAIWVGGAGDVAAVMGDGRVATFTGCGAGSVLPIAPKRINATGTTATNLMFLLRS